MTSFTPTAGARTGAISATAVISATGMFASPAHAEQAHEAGIAAEAAPVTAQLAALPASIERALAPAASPVVLAVTPARVAESSPRVTHTVVRGDTVWDLARHYGSTVTAIVDANNLDRRATVHVGDKLVIPGATKATHAKSASTKSTTKTSTHKATSSAAHTVRSGDTVWDLAVHYGTTVAAIVKANNLGSHAVIHVGDRLTIPGVKATTTTKSSTASGTTKSTTAAARYTVKSGDTLSKIAKAHGTSIKALQAENGLVTTKIKVGQKLKIPSKAEPAVVAPVAPAPPAETMPAPVLPPVTVPPPTAPASGQ